MIQEVYMSNLIKQKRLSLGLTQSDLAYLTCLSPRTIQKYEREGIPSGIRVNKLSLLSCVLGITTDDLLSIGGATNET